MRRTRHTTKLATSALALVAVACLWFFFAPASLGGRTSYVVTDGISMEPRFHAGDLVVVRRQSDYHVGEIVAYHSKVFHTVVLHRIIARDGSRYVFKGDNNNFVDFEHPAQSQLIGALWVHLPGAGSTLESVRSPALIGILIAVAVLLFAGTVFTRQQRRRRRARRAEEGAQPHTAGSAEPMVTALVIGFVALLPFIALALLAFTRASSAPQPASVPYQQSATLGYTAAAKPGPAYTGNRAHTGEPLFTHVVDDVHLRMTYRFHSPAQHSLAGRASLLATVASTSGWQTTLKLGGPTYFRGDRAVVTGTLSLQSLMALMRSVESTTAVRGSYTVAITPHVNAVGSLGGLPLHTSFTPQIRFSANQLEVQPIIAAGGPPAGGQPASSPFAPSDSGTATGRRYQPLYLSFGIGRLSVASARAIALGTIVAILCALGAALAFLRTRRRDEGETIRSRYGRLIVPVERVWQEPGVAVIDVADMDSLVAIAEHYDRSILHESTDDGEAFWVTDESGQFRYAVGSAAGGTRPSPAPVAASEAVLDMMPVASPFDGQAAAVSAEDLQPDDAAVVPGELPDCEPITAVHVLAQAEPVGPELSQAIAETPAAAEPEPAPAVAETTAPTGSDRAGEGEGDTVVSEEVDEWRAAYEAADASRQRADVVLARHGG
jgi:signal peptidase I